jgi:metal-sulfur cluster biosynthetic enzyme
MMITEQAVMKALETVNDPEIGIDVVNLGFIYDVKIEGDTVTVAMTLTMKGCPLHASLKSNAEGAIRKLAGAKEATVNIVWDPPWNPGMMSDKAKGIMGFSPEMLEE